MSEQIENKLLIHVEANSRHPTNHDSYDKQEHRYRKEYVNPNAWQLNVSSVLPANWKQCEWQINGEENDFEESIRQYRGSSHPGKWSLSVPTPDKYLISLEVILEDGRQLHQNTHYHLQDLLFVALGDSYFCGEGCPDKPGKTAPVAGPIACNLATFTKFLMEKGGVGVPMNREAVWQEKHVHRSHKSGMSFAVRRLESEEEGRVITFLNFARSGASIEKGFFAPREDDDWTTIGQIDEARLVVGERPIDVLFLSCGANDIQFSDRLIDLLRDDLPIIGDGGILGDDAINRRKEHKEALRQLEQLPEMFDRLAEELKSLNPGHVFISPYPLAQFDVINEDGEVETRSGCGIFDGPDMDIDYKDAALIKETGQKLNQTIRNAADKHGWYCVEGIVEGFAGHGRCSEDKYFFSAEESCFNQGDFRGTLHPNEKGNEVYARCIAAAVRERVWSLNLVSK